MVRDLELFYYSLIGLFFGILFFIKGWKWFRMKKLIEDIPTSKIRSIAMGLVEIYGEVVPWKNLLKSPFTNNNCVYYKCLIQEQRKRGKHYEWVTVMKEEKSTYFLLKDETASVLVDPRGAEIDIPLDFEFRSGLGIDPPPQVKKFLNSKGISFETFFGINKQMRYKEYFIAPGDKLYILGTAGDNPFFEEGMAKKNVEDIMIQKGNNIYYISDKSERRVLSSLRIKSSLGIIGGAILIIACAFLILYNLGLINII